ncbi:hypothetical protein GCM10009762_26980 [Dermacoccus barathri]|uniref:Uncharacterized protein n=1 Tax=Dermacoccus barathri TaxID=322601 RepID=A0ABN2C5Y5_9MICO
MTRTTDVSGVAPGTRVGRRGDRREKDRVVPTAHEDIVSRGQSGAAGDDVIDEDDAALLRRMGLAGTGQSEGSGDVGATLGSGEVGLVDRASRSAQQRSFDERPLLGTCSIAVQRCTHHLPERKAAAYARRSGRRRDGGEQPPPRDRPLPVDVLRECRRDSGAQQDAENGREVTAALVLEHGHPTTHRTFERRGRMDDEVWREAGTDSQ